MTKLKVTEEWRADSEVEAKDFMEKVRVNASEEGYTVGSCGYTKKEKKAKGEIVDEAWVVKVQKIFNGVWDV